MRRKVQAGRQAGYTLSCTKIAHYCRAQQITLTDGLPVQERRHDSKQRREDVAKRRVTQPAQRMKGLLQLQSASVLFPRQ